MSVLAIVLAVFVGVMLFVLGLLCGAGSMATALLYYKAKLELEESCAARADFRLERLYQESPN